MAKCKGSKCKSSADCDDCVVKAARKVAAKKTKERNAMLLLKAKILEKMPKPAPVDPFASYRSLPRGQKIYQPSAQPLTLQNVADEIERAFARRDRPSTLEKASVKQSAPTFAPTESYEVIPSFAAPTLESYEVIPRRRAPAKIDFGSQTEALEPPRRELPFTQASLEESVMALTDVSEFDDEDAMEALDEAMAPGAATLAASTEADEVPQSERSEAPSGFAAPGAAALSASTEARTLLIEEPMGPWVQELESKVKPIVFPLRASGVYTAPYEPPDIGAETARAMVYGDLEQSGFTSAILESAGGAALEPEMAPFFQTIAESEGLKPVKILKNTGREGVAMDAAMELKEAIPPIQTSEERKRAARRAKSAMMSEEEKLTAKKERQSKRDAKAAAKSLAESYGEAVFEGSAYKPTFTEEAGEIFDVEL